jgi:hemerythrin-like metal-binding protein
MAYQWDARLEKGIAPMDQTHQEFVELVDGLLKATDDELVSGLQTLVEHTHEHFDQENRWMDDVGFPPIMIHKGEHERVLTAMEEVLEKARAGDLLPARQLIDQLPAWFDQHAMSMDHALAMFMRNSGYSPARG